MSTYNIPRRVSVGFGEMSWDKVLELSGEFRAKCDLAQPEVVRMQKELHFARLLLMETAKEQSGRHASIDPKLLIDLVKLLGKSERMAQEYSIDLSDFNSFIYLLIQKAKKEKLARHEGEAHLHQKEAPTMIKYEFGHFKEKSERRK